MKVQKQILFKDILINIINEAEYNLSDVNTIKGKSFEEVLVENEGAPFDIHEKRKFLEKQKTFGGTGKVEFIIKRSTNEISTQIFINGSTNTYTFKKLPNKKHIGLFNYVCFIYLKPPEQSINNVNEEENVAGNTTPTQPKENSPQTDTNQSDNKQPTDNNKEDKENEEIPDKNNDIVYILSNIFNDTKIEEKISILSDFITRINSYGL